MARPAVTGQAGTEPAKTQDVEEAVVHKHVLTVTLAAFALSPLASTAEAAPLGITKAAVEQPDTLVEKVARFGGRGGAVRGSAMGMRGGAFVRRGGMVGARGAALRRAAVVRPGAGLAGASFAGAGVVGAGVVRPGWPGVTAAGVVQPGWGWRGGRWIRPAGYWWRPGGAIAAGAALGVISAANAAAWAGAAPGSNMCWHYADYWNQTQGFWDVCP
jgi:hypothetical protein